MNISAIGQPSWLVPQRVDAPELLDLGEGSPDDVRASFADMWRINRYLGGVNAIARHLYPRLKAANSPVTVADLGCGAAHFALALDTWAVRHGLPLRIVALDWTARNLDAAALHLRHHPRIHLIQADAMRLPLSGLKVDYLISSLFLHHFTPEQVVTLLDAAFGAAGRGIIMSDIVRGWLPLVGFRLGEPIFARNYLTRADGAASVLRAYTPAELAELARMAGLHGATVHEHFPWRMTLVADR